MATSASPAGARSRLSSLALAHVAGWTPEQAAGWLAEQRLLSVAEAPGAPAPLASLLRRRLLDNTALNLRWIARFQEVVGLFDDLPVCALKGIHLLATVHAAAPGARPMGDLDLLVPAAAREEAVARLRRAGFREARAAELPGGWHDAVLVHDDTVIDLHTRLGIKHGARSAWEDVAPVPAELHGRRVHVLDDETMLVHLVAHFVKHSPFSALGWAEDVLLWAERGFEPGRAVEVARRLGAAGSLAAGVRALRTVLGPEVLAGLPADRPGLAGAALRLNERVVWPHLSSRPLEAHRASSRLHRNASALLLSDGAADAAGFAAAKIRELLSRVLRSH